MAAIFSTLVVTARRRFSELKMIRNCVKAAGSSLLFVEQEVVSSIDRSKVYVRVIVHPWYEMTCETKYMQQLWFINNPLAQYVSSTIIPIFKSARLYITAYGFQHLMCWLVSLGSREAGRVHSVKQCFPTSVRPRHGKFFFPKTRARSQQIYS